MEEPDKKIIPLHKPSLSEKIFFLVSGMLISVPLTLFIGTFTENLCIVLPLFYARVCSTVIFAPLIEEFAKVYPLFYRHGETEKSIFSLGFLVGLGFGFSEFLVYVFQFGVPAYIRFSGLVFHGASTSIIAYGIAKNKALWFYLTAVLLHFSNNLSALFSVIYHPLWLAAVPAVIGITLFLSLSLYSKTSEFFISKKA